MGLPKVIEYPLGSMFIFLLGAGYAMSIQVRCMGLLVLPTFCGRSGRTYVGTFAVAFLLAGK